MKRVKAYTDRKFENSVIYSGAEIFVTVLLSLILLASGILSSCAKDPAVTTAGKSEGTTTSQADVTTVPVVIDDPAFENAENQYAFVNELVLLTKKFSDRLKSANTPSNTKLANTLYENFFDIISGVNIFDEKNNYRTNKIYIHDRELEYRNYLLSQIKTIQQYEVKKGEDKITQKEQ